MRTSPCAGDFAPAAALAREFHPTAPAEIVEEHDSLPSRRVERAQTYPPTNPAAPVTVPASIARARCDRTARASSLPNGPPSVRRDFPTHRSATTSCPHTHVPTAATAPIADHVSARPEHVGREFESRREPSLGHLRFGRRVETRRDQDALAKEPDLQIDRGERLRRMAAELDRRRQQRIDDLDDLASLTENERVETHLLRERTDGIGCARNPRRAVANDRSYNATPSRRSPENLSVPLSKTSARVQRFRIAPRLWLTNSTVRPSLCDVAHLAEALPLERRVADGQHFVDDQDLGSRCAATAKASRTYMPLE